MRIAYGYSRTHRALRDLDADRVYLDGPGTNRSERRCLFRDLREGDTLVVLAISDLGAGKGLRNMRDELADRRVSIEVAAHAAVEPKPTGRPPKWAPDAEQDERFRAMWGDVSVAAAYIVDMACEAMGEDKADPKARQRVRLRLHRRYGHRGQEKAPKA